MTLSVKEIEDQVRAKFTYKSDDANYGVPEYWTSQFQSVMNNQAWSGDCEDFALSCAHFAALEGYDRSKMALAYCLVGDVGHLVLFIGDDVLDNRNLNGPRDFRDINYTWMSHMPLDKPDQWFTGLPEFVKSQA